MNDDKTVLLLGWLQKLLLCILTAARLPANQSYTVKGARGKVSFDTQNDKYVSFTIIL
jgi:hypothetical protein